MTPPTPTDLECQKIARECVNTILETFLLDSGTPEDPALMRVYEKEFTEAAARITALRLEGIINDLNQATEHAEWSFVDDAQQKLRALCNAGRDGAE